MGLGEAIQEATQRIDGEEEQIEVPEESIAESLGRRIRLSELDRRNVKRAMYRQQIEEIAKESR